MDVGYGERLPACGDLPPTYLPQASPRDAQANSEPHLWPVGMPTNGVGHRPFIDAVRATRQCYPITFAALTASYGLCPIYPARFHAMILF